MSMHSQLVRAVHEEKLRVARQERRAAEVLEKRSRSLFTPRLHMRQRLAASAQTAGRPFWP
jgi:hypothetical protein